MKGYIAALAFCALAFSACKKGAGPDPVPNTENKGEMRTEWGIYNSDSLLEMNQRVSLPNSDLDYTVSAFSLYLNDVRVVNKAGDTLKVADLLLVTMNPNATKGADPQTVNKSFSWQIPNGRYTHLVFNTGVPAHLDGIGAPLATSYPDDHALSANRGTTWAWDNTYRHLTFMGDFWDKSAGNDRRTYSYHMRSSYFYSTAVLPINLNLQGGKQTAEVRIDINQIFNGPPGSINLLKENVSDGEPKDAPLVRTMGLNTTAAITIEAFK